MEMTLISEMKHLPLIARNSQICRYLQEQICINEILQKIANLYKAS